jgi:SAM-dependent methyltransferase
MSYHSEAAKVRDMPHVMKYIKGVVYDMGCGPDKIIPGAIGVDGRRLDGVDVVHSDPSTYSYNMDDYVCDTVFSSHFLEHLPDQWGAVKAWSDMIRPGGHLVLYLPDGRYYDNKENLEHMVDMNYEQFMFWFRRSFCGEGKNFRGEFLKKSFDVVDSGMDIGDDRYSFYVIAKKV